MSEANTIRLIGGPFDGIEVPNDGYFQEGDVEAVNTLEYCKPGSQWSAESVYRVKNGKLIYDSEATKKLASITLAR